MGPVVHDELIALPAGHPSLAFGGGDTVPGGLLALSASGGVRVRPGEGRSVYFGRNFAEVHVAIGVADRRVSRRQGVLTCRAGRWWVANTGNRPIRLPDSRWLSRDGEEPLAPGYTPLFVSGSGPREHLLELFVVAPDGPAPHAVVRPWRLSPDERLAAVVLGRRYLLHEANPRPLTWQEADARLAELQPGRWRAGRLERVVTDLRTRLSRRGVPGLREDEVPDPYGGALTDNLLRELVRTRTVVPPDLAVLDPDGPEPGGEPWTPLGR
ncbi:FHA domain-containing protein [Actinophytocola sp.]|uniref:FHA domain-containing protein n=1 Tax=Actinophytocola sp. TaxID=1872138 RepID=UPI003D6AB8F2